jgi:hypothetical protein
MAGNELEKGPTMPLPTIKFAYLGTIHSPFSGLPADLEEGPNEDDPTLLFAYYGDAGLYAYTSPRLLDVLDDDLDETDPLDLAHGLQIDGGLVLTVDTDWSGVNYYGFAPTESEISYAPGN